MKISTKQILNILLVISWIIFIGVCIEAGGFIFSAFYTLVINPIDAATFWREMISQASIHMTPGIFLSKHC